MYFRAVLDAAPLRYIRSVNCFLDLCISLSEERRSLSVSSYSSLCKTCFPRDDEIDRLSHLWSAPSFFLPLLAYAMLCYAMLCHAIPHGNPPNDALPGYMQQHNTPYRTVTRRLYATWQPSTSTHSPPLPPPAAVQGREKIFHHVFLSFFRSLPLLVAQGCTTDRLQACHVHCLLQSTLEYQIIPIYGNTAFGKYRNPVLLRFVSFPGLCSASGGRDGLSAH